MQEASGVLLRHGSLVRYVSARVFLHTRAWGYPARDISLQLPCIHHGVVIAWLPGVHPSKEL
jgi:hypothetical protein